MNPRSALGAAAAVALTVTGGVSAMFLTIGQANAGAAPTDQPAPAAEHTAVEYVDQYGNPVDAPTAISATPEIIYMNPDGTLAANPSAQPQAMAEPEMTAAYSEEYEAEEYEDGEEYEAEEYEEDESEEYEEEHEGSHDYAAAGAYHEEGDDHG